MEQNRQEDSGILPGLREISVIAQLDPLYVRLRPRKALVRVLSHLLFQGRFLTTDHRWLNLIILAELRGLQKLPQIKPVDRPIFIIGTGRSGTTVLGKVLSIHRDVGFLNEPKAMWFTVCSEEDVNGHFGRGYARYRLTAEDATHERRKAARNLYGAYLSITGTRRVVDKNPEMVFRIPFLKRIFPDAKFILLVRNGWDTVHSIAQWSESHRRIVRGASEDWWGENLRKWQLMVEQLVPSEPLLRQQREEIALFTREEDMAAVEWIITMQEGLRALHSWPRSVYLVRYEDLTRHPSETLETLLDFCKLKPDTIFCWYGEKVLTPVPHRAVPVIASSISTQFQDTMRALGYSVRPAQ